MRTHRCSWCEKDWVCRAENGYSLKKKGQRSAPVPCVYPIVLVCPMCARLGQK
jgi:hypothetical protein